MTYEPGSVLEYEELLVAVLARRGPLLRVCVTRIWVNSEASRAGGRQLWAIPKETARLDIRSRPRTVANADGIAAGAMVDCFGVPGRWPIRYKLTQQDERGKRESPVRLRARLSFAASAWRMHRDGPLTWLCGRKPIMSLRLRDFDMLFGD